MEKYIEYVGRLSWNRPKSEQAEAVLFLSSAKDWDYTDCIVNSQKDIWEKLVHVISHRTKDEIKSLLSNLLYLLKDLNWPGAIEAMNLIKGFSKDEILKEIEQSLLTAYSENDGIWIANMKAVIEYYKLKPDMFNCIDLQKILLISEW